MAHFPNSLGFTGFNTPSRVEGDVAGLVHEGTIPPQLNGDGMIARFHLHHGKIGLG